MTVEPGQGPENELFVCWIPSVTSQYLSPGVEGGRGEGSYGFQWKRRRDQSSLTKFEAGIFSANEERLEKPLKYYRTLLGY